MLFLEIYIQKIQYWFFYVSFCGKNMLYLILEGASIYHRTLIFGSVIVI